MSVKRSKKGFKQSKKIRKIRANERKIRFRLSKINVSKSILFVSTGRNKIPKESKCQ